MDYWNKCNVKLLPDNKFDVVRSIFKRKYIDTRSQGQVNLILIRGKHTALHGFSIQIGYPVRSILRKSTYRNLVCSRVRIN